MSEVKSCKCKSNIECHCKHDIDYYDILSLSRNCTHLDILSAFQRLSARYKIENKSINEIPPEFHLIAEGFAVLSNPIRRIVYDNFGFRGLEKHIPEPYGWAETFIYHGNPINTYRSFFGPSKFCSDLLNSTEDVSLLEKCQKPKKKLCKADNVEKKLYLTLKEIFFGALKKMSIKKRIISDSCPCDTIIQEKIFEIPIKPGLPSGSRIVFLEEGNEAPFTIPGDVIFTSIERPHKIFQRDGANLLMEVKVSLQESLLGTTVVVNTIDDRIIRINVTSLVIPDYTRIVSGEGLPLAENWRERGDLVIIFKIEFPLYLTVSCKNDIKRAFTAASKYTAKEDNEYIHRFILYDKMGKNDEPSTI